MTRSDGPTGRRDFAYDAAGRLDKEYLDDPGLLAPVADPGYVNGEMASAAYATPPTWPSAATTPGA